MDPFALVIGAIIIVVILLLALALKPETTVGFILLMVGLVLAAIWVGIITFPAFFPQVISGG